MTIPRTDLLTFGETMLRFAPRPGKRLSTSTEFEVWVAGSELNTAAAFIAMGGAAAWVSRLPDNMLGRKIESALLAKKIDVSNIIWRPSEERVGTFYYEAAEPPRPAVVYYDRAGSAASQMERSDLPDNLLLRFNHVHLTGITMALSSSCAALAKHVAERARALGLTTSLDFNFRAKLWSAQKAEASLSDIATDIDILFCSKDDSTSVFGLFGTGEERVFALQSKYGIETVVLTCGAAGAVGVCSKGVHTVPALPIEKTIERLGSGDAFAGGFLSKYLFGRDLLASLHRGTVVAAIKRSVAGDMLESSRSELESVIQMEENLGWR